MDRRALLAGLASAGAAASTGTATATPRMMIAKVQALADQYAKAWNASDMDAMSRLYTPDVHWVNIVGMHWQGKSAVDRAHRAFFEIMFKGVPLRLEEIESVRPLPGDAVVAVLRWSVGAYRTPTGQPAPASRDRMTLVLVPAGDTLLIAHGANIHIDELAQRSDPMRSTQ